ncbi:MAG: recombinase family protein [Clostridia bacterium]|nr:recombinase family protein [Clostridia bacterium]
MNGLNCNQVNNNLLFTVQNTRSAKYKVAGYLRLSTEDGDKEVSDSIISQRSIIENKIKELGEDFELVDFYIDDGYTGLNTNRPSFQRMLQDVETSKINTIITKDLSRLSRNNFEANYYIELYFLERNIRYISVLDNVDTYLKNSNNDMIGFKTLVNDWYSRDISRKVKSGVWARKEKGLYLSSRAPYGYNKSKSNKNQLIVNKEQAEIVKLIFEKLDSGERQSTIAKFLQEQKVLAPSSYDDNGVFRKNVYKWDCAVSKILRNKVYLGHTEYGKRINLSYKSEKVKYIPKDEWKIVLNTHEPIIDKELFDRIQRKLNIMGKTKRVKFEWLLNGLVYCKECGSQMVLKVEYRSSGEIKSKRLHCVEGIRKNSNIFCNRKSRGIGEEALTKIVLRNVKDKIDKIMNAEKLENLILAQYKESNTRLFDDTIKNYKEQLAKIEKNITSLYEDYRNEILEQDDYKRFYKAELERKNNIKSNIVKLKKEMVNKPRLSLEQLQKIIEDISNIDSWNKQRLADLIYNVEVDIENNIYINYRYDIFEMV